MVATDGLADVERRDLRSAATTTAEEFVGRLATVSAYLRLAPGQRADALRQVRAVLPDRVTVDTTVQVLWLDELRLVARPPLRRIPSCRLPTNQAHWDRDAQDRRGRALTTLDGADSLNHDHGPMTGVPGGHLLAGIPPARQRRRGPAAGPVLDRGLPGAVGRTDATRAPGSVGIRHHHRARGEAPVVVGRAPVVALRDPDGRPALRHRWSKLATSWRGVSLDTLLADVDTAADFAMAHSYGGYTTNLPLADLLTARRGSCTSSKGQT